MKYNNEMVTRLASLINEFGTSKLKIPNPFVGIFWKSFKPAIPGMLQRLDNNPLTIEELRRRLQFILDGTPYEQEPEPLKLAPVKEEAAAEEKPLIEIEAKPLEVSVPTVKTAKKKKVEEDKVKEGDNDAAEDKID